MSVDRQLPLEPTERIDPSTQVTLMPGTDAVCECDRPSGRMVCLWPWCDWTTHMLVNEQEDE